MAILDASGGAGLGLGTATAAGRRESFKTSLYLLTVRLAGLSTTADWLC